MASVKLIRQFRSICARMGVTGDRYEALKESYGVASCKDMTERDLQDAILKLQGFVTTQTPQSEAGVWRRRVMAAIGAHLRRTGRAESLELIKAIALRAAKDYCDFNQIPVSELRGIYYEFVRQNKAAAHTTDTIARDIQSLAQLN